jgi:hypothetical protein
MIIPITKASAALISVTVSSSEAKNAHREPLRKRMIPFAILPTSPRSQTQKATAEHGEDAGTMGQGCGERCRGHWIVKSLEIWHKQKRPLQGMSFQRERRVSVMTKGALPVLAPTFRLKI